MAVSQGGSKSKSQQLISDTQLLAGLQKHLPNTTFILQAVRETTAQVESVIQARVDKALAVITARTALHAAVLTSLQEDEASNAFVQDVRLAVRSMYSTSPSILGDFGVTGPKPRTSLTVAQKLIAAAKRMATREARGTTSAKKKAAIVGTVTGSIMVPVDGSATSIVSSPPAAPVPAPQPAAQAALVTTNGSTTPHS